MFVLLVLVHGNSAIIFSSDLRSEMPAGALLPVRDKIPMCALVIFAAGAVEWVHSR